MEHEVTTNITNWMEFLLTAKETVMGIPGPVWVAVTLAMIACARYINHRLASIAPDNRSSFYNRVLQLLGDPNSWRISGSADSRFSIAANSLGAKVYLPYKSKGIYGSEYIDNGGWFRNAFADIYVDSDNMSNFLTKRQRRNITRKAKETYYTLKEQETQKTLAKCLNTISNPPTPAPAPAPAPAPVQQAAQAAPAAPQQPLYRPSATVANTWERSINGGITWAVVSVSQPLPWPTQG